MKQSSAIKSIEVSEDGINVTFKSGKTYNYPTATREIVAEVLSSESLGKGFSKHMRSLPAFLVD